MVHQVNVKFQDSFYQLVLGVVKKGGYMSAQEFIRIAVRDYINDQITPEEKMYVEKVYDITEKDGKWLNNEKLLESLTKN